MNQFLFLSFVPECYQRVYACGAARGHVAGYQSDQGQEQRDGGKGRGVRGRDFVEHTREQSRERKRRR